LFSVSFSTIIFFSPSAFFVFSIFSYIPYASAPYILSPCLAPTVADKSASAATAGITGYTASSLFCASTFSFSSVPSISYYCIL
jgi:hypothetical protein